MNLSGMSASALESLAKRATALAEDLRKDESSYDLAIANGVRDEGYSTVRYGRVSLVQRGGAHHDGGWAAVTGGRTRTERHSRARVDGWMD